jgi:hypothetical protein
MKDEGHDVREEAINFILHPSAFILYDRSLRTF